MAMIPDEAIERMGEVSGAAFKLYAYFCRRRNHKTGDCFPSLRLTANDTGLHYSYASEVRSELVRAGWIDLNAGVITPIIGFKVSEKPKMISEKPKQSHRKISENPNTISENPKHISENPKRYIKDINQPNNQPNNQVRHTQKKKGTVVEKKGTRIPDSFILTPDMRQWAAKYPDVNLTTETEKFVNYWRSKAGKDARKIDWTATWRNWIISANEYRGTKTNGTHNKNKSADKLTDYNRMFDKYGSNGNAG